MKNILFKVFNFYLNIKVKNKNEINRKNKSNCSIQIKLNCLSNINRKYLSY